MPIVYRTASGSYVDPNGNPAEAPADAQADAPDYGAMEKADLVALADERGLDVTRADGKDGDPLVSDYVRALSA